MAVSSDYLIKILKLEKHPEGGYFSEVYRSDEVIKMDHLPGRYNSDRNFSTSIYFLLEGDDFSAFHRVSSDEIWHFYAGTALTLYVIGEGGDMKEILLGNNPENNESFFAVIKKGQWFAAKTNQTDSYTLVGCTVAPGFDFKDFELGDRMDLIKQFPQHHDLIIQSTRDANFSHSSHSSL